MISKVSLAIVFVLIFSPAFAYAVQPHYLLKDVTPGQATDPFALRFINGTYFCVINSYGVLEDCKLENFQALPAITASRVVTTDSSGYITTSTISTTILGYLSTLSSNVQDQIDAISGSMEVNTMEGGSARLTKTNSTSEVILKNFDDTTTIAFTNGTDSITANVVTGSIDDAELGTGIDTTQLGSGGVTSTEFGYIGTLSSDAQTQINSKGALDDVHLEGTEISNSRPDLNFNDTSTINVNVQDSSATTSANVTMSIVANSIDDAELGTGIDAVQIGGGGVTSSEFDFLADVTSLIQAQINGKQATLGYTAENIANKNQNNGYAGLGSTGQIPVSQMNATFLSKSLYNTVFGIPQLNSVGKLNSEQMNSTSSGITEVNTMEGGSARLTKTNSTSEVILKNFDDTTTIAFTNGTDSITANVVTGSIDDAELGTGIDAVQIGDGSVTSTEFQRINTVSSNVQDQLDGKQATLGYTAGTLDDILLENIEISNSRANLNYNDTSTINFSINDDPTKGQANVTADIVANSIGDAQIGTGIDTTQLGTGGVTSTEFGYIGTLSSDAQTQINGKQATLGYTAENIANKNQNNGYAGLGSTGQIPVSQMNATFLSKSLYNTVFGIPQLNSVGKLNSEQMNSTSSGITEVNTMEGGSARLSKTNSTSEVVLKNFLDTGTISWTNGTTQLSAGIVANSIDDAELGTGIDTTQLAGGGVTSSEFDFIATLSSNAQTQITARELSSNKGIADGYPSLNNLALLSNNQLASNTNSSENCLKGDRTWGSCSAGSGITEVNTIEGGSARLSKTNSTSEVVLKNFLDTGTISWTNGTTQLSAGIVANSIDDAELGTGIDAVQIGGGGVTSTEFDFLADVTSLIQAQFTGKQSTSEKGSASGYTPLNSNSLIPSRFLGSGTNSSSNFLRGDNSWSSALVTSITGTANNLTASASTGAITLNLGSNVLTTGGSAQTITKGLTLNSATLGGQINFNGQTILNTGTLTLPTSTDTLMGKATTDTMTEKTLRTNSTGNAVIADPSLAILTAGGATLQASGSPPKTTIDGTNMDYITLDFDPSTDETVIWNFEIPTDVDASQNIAVDIKYLKSSAGASDGVCWSGAFLGRVAGEAVDSSFGTAVLTCDSTINTAGQLDTHHLSFTTAQHGLSAGDVVFFKLFRDADNGSDGLTVDIRLIDVKVSWT